eukprot:7075191-Pyramimonas_sp.AAC.1
MHVYGLTAHRIPRWIQVAQHSEQTPILRGVVNVLLEARSATARTEITSDHEKPIEQMSGPGTARHTAACRVFTSRLAHKPYKAKP